MRAHAHADKSVAYSTASNQIGNSLWTVWKKTKSLSLSQGLSAERHYLSFLFVCCVYDNVDLAYAFNTPIDVTIVVITVCFFSLSGAEAKS